MEGQIIVAWYLKENCGVAEVKLQNKLNYYNLH